MMPVFCTTFSKNQIIHSILEIYMRGFCCITRKTRGNKTEIFQELSAFGIDESTEKAAFTVLCIKTRSIRKEYDARVYSIPRDEKRLRPWTCKRIRMRDEITKPVLVCSHHVIAAIMKTDCCCIKTAAIFSTKKRETIPTSHHRSLILPRT